MKTITADQARELTDKNTTIKIDFTLEEVYSLIEQECVKGSLYLFLDGNIGEQTAKQLQEDGFDVRFDKYTVKSGMKITFSISWQVV